MKRTGIKPPIDERYEAQCESAEHALLRLDEQAEGTSFLAIGYGLGAIVEGMRRSRKNGVGSLFNRMEELTMLYVARLILRAGLQIIAHDQARRRNDIQAVL